MNYIIFIGGSGARAYTAFLHACAAGAVHTEQVNVMLLDADTENAACENSIKLFQLYKKHREMLGDTLVHDMPFCCDVHMVKNEVVSPIYEDDITHLDQVAAGNGDRKRALQWFYTSEERKQKLKKGFYAHPNIGCIFFQNFNPESPIINFVDNIISESNSDSVTRVVIVGSVFGGTGAAGIPSILKILKERCSKKGVPFNQLHCCGVLITPYFKVVASDDCTENTLTINSDKFYCGTKAALPYYKFNDDFERTYLVGQTTLDVVNLRYEDGGKDQDNKPHIVEILAALAIMESLESKPGGKHILGQYVDRDNMQITWDLLGSNMCGLANMLRTQTILETAIYPCAVDKADIHRGYQWRKVYHIDSNKSQDQLKIMREYSESFFYWMYCIQNRYLENSTEMSADAFIQLCDSDVFSHLHNRIRERKPYSVERPQYEEKGGWRQYQDDFIKLVETAEGIEYVAKKVGLILSALGVLTKRNTGLRCAGLFLKLFSLLSHTTN